MMKVWIDYDGKKHPAPHTEKELLRTSKLWKRNAQAKLRRDGKNSSGALKKSMKIRLGMNQNQPYADLSPSVDYWEFVDLGVRGAKDSPFKRQSQSPFKFKSKKPPLNSILKWMRDKPVKARNKTTGKFETQESAAFKIQNAIWRRGLRPTFFISDTGDRIEKKYSVTIADAYAQDMQAALINSILE